MKIVKLTEKFMLSLSISGLLLVSLSFFFPQIPIAIMSFYFFILWLLWYVMILISQNQKIIAAQWVAIDCSILIMFISITFNLGNVLNDRGSDMIWFISYAPVIIPIGYIYALIQDFMPAIEFSIKYQSVLSIWLLMTFIAALQSILVLYATKKIKSCR